MEKTDMSEDVKHRGEFCFNDDCELDIISWENGIKSKKRFRSGKYYWIDTITHYADGYSDIKWEPDSKFDGWKYSLSRTNVNI